MKIRYKLLLILFFLSIQNLFSQPKKILLISTIEYDSVYLQLLHFSIVNNSDSIFRFTIPNVVQRKCLNLIQKHTFIKDTLVIDFRLKRKLGINASGRLNFQLEDVYYLQDYILSQNKIDFALKLTSQEYTILKHLKIVFPNNTILLKNIQKR